MNSRIRRRCANTSAFSLIELLVVMALMTALSIPAYLRIREGRDTRSMMAAQDLIAGQLAAARNHAIVSRKACRLLVYSDRDDSTPDELKLRCLLVAVANEDGMWRAVELPVCLPGNIRLVPRTAPPSSHPGGWADAPVSRLPNAAVHSILVGDRLQSVSCYPVEFNALGNTTGATLVLSPAVVQPTAGSKVISFNHPGEVSGIRVSQYGALTRVPNASAF